MALVFTYSLVDSSDSSTDSFDSPDFSSLKSSEIAPILPNVADKSAGKNIFVAFPSATFSSDSRYLIAIKSFVGSPLCIAAKTFSIIVVLLQLKHRFLLKSLLFGKNAVKPLLHLLGFNRMDRVKTRVSAVSLRRN